MRTKVFIADTTDGPRVIRANDMRQAKKFALDTYLRGMKRATADELVSLMESESERLVIEDATRIELQQPQDSQS